MKSLMIHLSVHFPGEKGLNAGGHVIKVTKDLVQGSSKRKDIFLCQCSEADGMLKAVAIFLPFKWKSRLCKFKISRLQQL